MTVEPRLDEYGFPVERKRARPQARMGAGLVMGGAVLHVIAVFITWYTYPDGGELRGLDQYIDAQGDPFQGPGRVWLVMGGLLFAAGLFTLIQGRIFGLAAATMLLALVALLTSLIGVGAADNMIKFFGGEKGKGVYLGIVAIIIAMVGSIRVLAQRQR